MFGPPVYYTADESGFKGPMLDALLSNGFYRMQHHVFTTNHTQFDVNSYMMPVFWLRLELAKVQESKSAQKIRKKCAKLQVTIKLAEITDEIRHLYSLYWEFVPFSTSEQCDEYLHDATLPNPFDSWMIEVRDHGRLVAVGYFDKGLNSIAGILNFFDPEYQSYSLGKFLILCKMDHARAIGCSFYYTGYISTATEKFDYKLFPDINAIEVFLPLEKHWVPYTNYDKTMLEQYFFNGLV